MNARLVLGLMQQCRGELGEGGHQKWSRPTMKNYHLLSHPCVFFCRFYYFHLIIFITCEGGVVMRSVASVYLFRSCFLKPRPRNFIFGMQVKLPVSVSRSWDKGQGNVSVTKYIHAGAPAPPSTERQSYLVTI